MNENLIDMNKRVRSLISRDRFKRICKCFERHGMTPPDEKDTAEDTTIKIPEYLYARLKAVKTIVSTSCSYEEAQCAYEELEHILDHEFTIY